MGNKPRKVDGSLAGDGLRWNYGRTAAAPPSISSVMKGSKTPSISGAMKGKSTTISTAKIVPRKKGGVGLYGPLTFSKFGKAKLANLGKKVYG